MADIRHTDRRPRPLLRTVVGEVLRRRRQEQRRTLAEVARDANVSVPYLSEVERGRKEPSSEVLAAICDSLRIDLADMLAEVRHDLTADLTTGVTAARAAGLTAARAAGLTAGRAADLAPDRAADRAAGRAAGRAPVLRLDAARMRRATPAPAQPTRGGDVLLLAA